MATTTLYLLTKEPDSPVLEAVPSTNFKVNKERLKRTFTTYGTPKII